jgi:sugar lactone lactonase YvrE
MTMCWMYAEERAVPSRMRGRFCRFVARSPDRLIQVLLVSGLFLSVCGGCATSPKPIFEPLEPSMVWPPMPATPRVRYVGTLETDRDLKPPTSFLKALGNVFVGDEPPAPLYGPRAILRSRDGRSVWVADPGGRCLHRFDLSDRTYLKIQQLGGSPLLTPVGLCLGDDDSFYVCDSERGSIHELSIRNGALRRTLRLAEDLDRPVALAYRAERGELYVVDVTTHNVKVLDSSGGLLRIIGRRGTGPGEFNYPCALAADEEGFWIVDTGNHRIQRLTWDGEPVAAFGRAGDAPGDLALPKGVAVDSDGHVYVVDARFENVQVFDRSGRLLLAFGEEGTGPGAFWLPSGIHIDAADRIWVCDSYNRRIQVFDYLRSGASGPEGQPELPED